MTNLTTSILFNFAFSDTLSDFYTVCANDYYSLLKPP